MESSLPPIPTSAAVKSREFRNLVLPRIVFGAVMFIIIITWWLYLSAPILVGQVEPISILVNSPKAGVLADMNLTRLQNVKAGEVVGKIVTTDPQVVEASIAVERATIALLKTNLEPEVNAQRYAIQFDRLRLDAMQQRVELATSQVRLAQSERDLRRAQSLSEGKIVSDSAFEQTKALHDRYQSDVTERTKLVADMEKSLAAHRVGAEASDTAPQNPPDVLGASIAVEDAKLKLIEAQLEPIPLRAPVDGVISVITRRNGESVTAGEPIATVTAHTSDHIVGYLRQPLTVHVAVGMKVEVQARSFNRVIGNGKILSVGSQLEPINPVLLLTTSSSMAPVLGLPLDISLPPGMRLVPGEVVDIALR